jgi:hypothetical protein
MIDARVYTAAATVGMLILFSIFWWMVIRYE